MGNKAPAGPLPEFGPMAIRCPPEDANPLTIHGTREAMLDLSTEVGRRSNALYAQIETQLNPTKAQLRQNFGTEDVPEVMPKLINNLKEVNEQVARIYCLVRRQSKIAGMAYRPLEEGTEAASAASKLGADWTKASGGGGLSENGRPVFLRGIRTEFSTRIHIQAVTICLLCCVHSWLVGFTQFFYLDFFFFL